MLFLVVMRHCGDVRRIEMNVADEREARLLAERQNVAIAAEHRTPLYEVESVTNIEPPRSWRAKLFGR